MPEYRFISSSLDRDGMAAFKKLKDVGFNVSKLINNFLISYEESYREFEVMKKRDFKFDPDGSNILNE